MYQIIVYGRNAGLSHMKKNPVEKTPKYERSDKVQQMTILEGNVLGVWFVNEDPRTFLHWVSKLSWG